MSGGCDRQPDSERDLRTDLRSTRLAHAEAERLLDEARQARVEAERRENEARADREHVEDAAKLVRADLDALQLVPQPAASATDVIGGMP